MSFHTPAANIRIEDRSWLKAADLFNGGGEHVEAAIDLNTCLGNNEGPFEWGVRVRASNTYVAYFADAGQDVCVSLEGDDRVPVLRACLADSECNYHFRDVNLAERIGNNIGELYFCK
ncbi:hypothetical protein RB595_000651 [Gaeumannomyces hyphopodioides]